LKSRITFLSMKILAFLRKAVQNIVKEIEQYQEKWLQHVQRMDTNRIPKQALQYKPKGRRNIGRPRNRWRDQFHFEDQEKETRLILHEHDDDDDDDDDDEKLLR